MSKINAALNKQEVKNTQSIKNDRKNDRTKNGTNVVKLYPHLDNADFNKDIAEKREFYNTQYDGTISNVVDKADQLANLSTFELSPHQIFIKNFLSMYTPYNSLLLYHGLGSGKTCSAIGVCEERRNYMRNMDVPMSKMYVVASPFVQDNFKLQLFNESKLRVSKNGECTYDGCVGNAILNEINPGNIPYTGSVQEITDHVKKEVHKIIRASYSFMGYEKFSNLVGTKFKDRETTNFFNNRLIVIDEIHNIRKQGSTISENLTHMLQMSSNTQLLLLTATPMFNHYTEIVWLVNLLNVNDHRGVISIKNVFSDDGEFVKGGKELLIRKMTGYVSYVRGENPYTFPFRIYPNIFSPSHTFPDVPYPMIKPNGAKIMQPMLYLKPYLTPMGSHQMNVYRQIMNYQVSIDGNLYSINNISKCIQCSIVAYPFVKAKAKPMFHDEDSDEDEESESESESTKSTKSTKSQTTVLPADMANANMEDDEEEDEEFDPDFIKKYLGNHIPDDVTDSQSVGVQGLKQLMTYTVSNNELNNFDYKPNVPHIFQLDKIGAYSSKISSICNMLQQNKDEGIILIYSKYIFAGILPMALALEELGFSNGSSRGNLMNSKKRGLNKSGHSYVMITGNKLLTPDFSIVDKINHANNLHGDKIKVVLISDSGSEGIDLQGIRQIHVLDPWFNLNRIEQIIGRGVRNFSHRRLPFKDRNVEIFLHAATVTDRNASLEEESMDLYQYRLAEKKAIQIGQVSRLVKEHAVDCILNHAQTNFTAENFSDQPVTIQLSDGQTIRDYTFGDQPFTSVCDYMATCDYSCKPAHKPIKAADINDTTYNLTLANTNIVKIVEQIKYLMADSFFYTKMELVSYVNAGLRTFPVHLIDLALDSLISNKVGIRDKYKRAGTLVNIGDYYLFQPDTIDVSNLSIQDRSNKLNVNYNVIPFKQITADSVVKDATVATHMHAGQDIFMEVYRKYKLTKISSQHVSVNSKKKSMENLFGEAIHFIIDRSSSSSSSNNQTKTDEQINVYLTLFVHHLFDTMVSITDKIHLMNFVQTNNLDNIEYDIRDQIKSSLFFSDLAQYILTKTFLYRKTSYIYFIVDPILKKEDVDKIPGLYFKLNPTSNSWEETPELMRDELGAAQNQQFKINDANRTIDGKTLSEKTGFIGYPSRDPKTKIFKIKIVDTIKHNTQVQTLKGLNCLQENPEKILDKLKWVAAASDNAVYNFNKLEEKKSRDWLCILLELTFRRLNDLRTKNKTWFVSTEVAVAFRF